jgi:hypothetical protein
MKCDICDNELYISDRVISVDEYKVIRNNTGMYIKGCGDICINCWKKILVIIQAKNDDMVNEMAEGLKDGRTEEHGNEITLTKITQAELDKYNIPILNPDYKEQLKVMGL